VPKIKCFGEISCDNAPLTGTATQHRVTVSVYMLVKLTLLTQNFQKCSRGTWKHVPSMQVAYEACRLARLPWQFPIAPQGVFTIDSSPPCLPVQPEYFKVDQRGPTYVQTKISDSEECLLPRKAPNEMHTVVYEMIQKLGQLIECACIPNVTIDGKGHL